VTPDELRKLADEAMDSPVEHPSERFLELMFLAPDLARLCAEMADELARFDWDSGASTALAKLAELEAR